MELYAAIDLHSRNNFLAVMDGEGKTMFKKKLTNDPVNLLEVIERYRDGASRHSGGVYLQLVLVG